MLILMQVDFFDFEMETDTQHVASVDVTIECLRYLEDMHSASLDILHRYPTIKDLFRYVNATVPSSATIERLFSKGALIAVPRRNRQAI